LFLKNKHSEGENMHDDRHWEGKEDESPRRKPDSVRNTAASVSRGQQTVLGEGAKKKSKTYVVRAKKTATKRKHINSGESLQGQGEKKNN